MVGVSVVVTPMKATLTVFGAVPTVRIWYGASAKAGFVQPAVAQLPGVVLDDVRGDVRVGGLGRSGWPGSPGPSRTRGCRRSRRCSPSRCRSRWSGCPCRSAVPSPRFESRLPCISSPASTSRTLAAPTAVRTSLTTVAQPGRMPGVAARRLQLAVEVVRVQDREGRPGRPGRRSRAPRPREASRAAATSSRIGRERLTGAPPRRGHARGRSRPAPLRGPHKGTDGTLAPRPRAGHGRTAPIHARWARSIRRPRECAVRRRTGK